MRFKSDAKNADFHANYELYKEFLLRFKSDAKYADFHANQSNLLMGVVTVYFYSKRFHFAPSFNNST